MSPEKTSLRRLPYFTIAIAAAALAIQFLPGLAACLAYDRGLMMSGQAWRVWTCHVAHWSWNHFMWDAIAFVALAGYCETVSRRNWAIVMGLAPVAITATVFLRAPELSLYRGLSGLDSAFYGLMLRGFMGAFNFRKPTPEMVIGAVGALLFLVKIFHEMSSGTALFASESGAYTVVPAVHLVGFITGFLVACRIRKSPGQECLTSRASAAINM